MTQERLKEIFDYHPDGYFIAKVKRGKCMPGKIVKGSPDGKGYLQITVDWRVHRFHRLVFLWHKGFLPDQIDHINRNRADARIENLRPATPSENGMNSGKRRDNGLPKGVSICEKTGRYRAKIKVRARQIHLGYYPTVKEAAGVYGRAAKKYFGAFAPTPAS